PGCTPSAPSSCAAGGGLDAGLRWFAAFVVAAIVLVVLRLIWATVGGWRPRPKVARVVVEPTRVVDESIPVGPSGDLLDGARAALAEGRWADAVLLSRGAALRRLGEVGKLLLQRSRTDREYVRRLAGDPRLHGELRQVVSLAERVRYGARGADATTASAAVEAAQRLLGALAVALLVALAPPARAQDYHAYNPFGDAALLPLFEQYGYDAGWRLRTLQALGEGTDVLVLDLSSVTPSADAWAAAVSWVDAGGVMVVFGDLSSVAGDDPEAAVVVDPGAWGTGAPTGTAVVRIDFARAGLPAPRFPNPPAVYTGGAGRPLVDWVVGDGVEGQVAVVLDRGAGVIVAIADPVLLRNGSLVHPDNERFLGELVYLGQSLEGWPVATPAVVQFATSVSVSQDSGDATTTPLQALAQSGLLLFVVQLVVTFLLAGARAGYVFGPRRDPPDEGRQRFAEHVTALGTRYHHRKDSGWALHQLASLWLGRLGRSGLELAAQRAGYTPADARAWAETIEAAAASPPPRGADDLARMEELWRVTCKAPI
ncbi:MAG: DUF4129 domain-containing protein, partial [Myxococcota bacterium]